MGITFIFLDGFGLGENDAEKNPMVSSEMPFILSLFGGNPLTAELKDYKSPEVTLVQTDPCLGVEGIPQSATGQTTILTGKNAAKIAGRHINAYPTKILKEVLAEYSVYKQLLKLGFSVTSANAYSPHYFKLVQAKKRRHSVTTIAALTAGLKLRTLDDLLAGNAVYQDITNELLIEQGYDLPLITPELAGERLAELASNYDFCLFEYFQTDLAGHKKDKQLTEKILNIIDRFLGSVCKNSDLKNNLIVITSDHGNIEDLSLKTHTCNFVPTILIGKKHQEFGLRIKSLRDLTPTVIDFFKGNLA